MANSGATVSEQTLKDYLDLKMHKTNNFMMIKFSSKLYKEMVTSHLEPQCEGVSNKTQWEKMKKLLNDSQATFIVFKMSYKTKDGAHRGKLLFISWIPDSCSLKEKMVYAASKNTLKNKLEGVKKRL
ncbi:uncharacterized protein LOC134840391 [Symsagittifera roscoffensis]|uniref:uncharacterized protein LOC134840391 n=1 Tax=Symsagittifera roscoffensis TaxID=84072 RepID=UPI00307B6C38